MDPAGIESVLTESGSNGHNFVIPQAQTEEDTVIPNELSDMLSSLLTTQPDEPVARKRRGRSSAEHSLVPESDYVYDVYQILSEPLTDQNHPKSQIGYIRFFDDDNEFYQLEDENDSTRAYTDDEDSNAESFYQNDYPSDEDADADSELFGTELDAAPIIVESAENEDGETHQSESGFELYEDRYDEFFDDEGGMDLLVDDQFERQHFFEGEEDDELAIHRDRIFSRLQRMIDEQ